MKSQEIKLEYIKLRAENKSYRHIESVLGIDKNTCTKWEKEFKQAIAELKSEQLNELYESYYMTKQARIKHLGETLKRIDVAIDDTDLSEVPPERLLDFKLKYTQALKDEYISTGESYEFSKDSIAKDTTAALVDLLNRIKAGEITGEQATKENAIISSIADSYVVNELKAKVDQLCKANKTGSVTT